MIYLIRNAQKFSFLFLVFAILVFLESGNVVWASSGSVEIKVIRILKNEKEPVQGVRCKLLQAKGSKDFQKKSNKKGLCEFDKIPTGKYYMYLYSSKFKKGFKDWSLPIMNRKVKVGSGDNQFNITCKRAVKIKGVMEYQGKGAIQKSYIFSWSGQQNTKPDKNGKFTLPGLHPDLKAKILVSIINVDSNYSPPV